MTSPASAPQKPLVERAGWAVFWNVAFFPLKLIIPFLAGIVIVRQLRAEGFAIYIVSLGLLDALGLLTDFGIDRTLPRFLPEIELKEGKRGVLRFLRTILGIKSAMVLIAILALAVAPQLWIDGFKLGEDGAWILVIIGALLVLGTLSDISIQLLYTHFRQKATNALDVMVAVVRPGLMVLFILLGWGALGALLSLLIATIASVVISVWLAVRLVLRLSEEPGANAANIRKPSNRPLKTRLVSFAGLNYMINWSVWLYNLDFVGPMIALLIVSEQRAQVEIAAIGLAYKFTNEFLRALVIPLTGVQTPLFSRLYAENRLEGLRTAYATITKVLILLLLPATVGLIFTCRNVLQILYGNKGGDAVFNAENAATIVTCTIILAVGLFGEAMISVALNVLMVYENYRAVILARCVSLISVPLLVLLVPAWGAVGGAIAVSGAALGSRLVGLTFGLRLAELHFPITFFMRVGLASAVMGAVLAPFFFYLPPDLLWTVTMVALGIVVFFGVFKLLGGMDQADKDRFLSLRLPFVKQAVKFL